MSAHRVFVSACEEDGAAREGLTASSGTDAAATTNAATAPLVRALRQAVVGHHDAVPTPMGPRRITYVDHTASGRCVNFVEEYIRDAVLPMYANTHTTTSECGFQSHMFLSEARDIVRDSVNASEREDVVLFCGRGATAASVMLTHFVCGRGRGGGGGDEAAAAAAAHACTFPLCGRRFGTLADLHMHARTHPDGEATAWQTARMTHHAAGAAPASRAPLDGEAAHAAHANVHVIVGPYAHHSSFLPWQSAGATLHFVPESAHATATATATGVDLAALADVCATLRARNAQSVHIVAVFTMGSNVTGALVDVPTVSALCHAFGVPVFWDAAAAAPHTGVDMNSKRTFTSAQLVHAVSRAAATDDVALVAERPGVQHLAALPPTALHASCADALFFSMHKFTAGPGAPGILVVKRRLLSATTPFLPGGGTVFFVHADGTPRFLANDAEREEGGSPDLLAAVRAGLAWHVHRSVGVATIAQREAAFAAAARARWAAHPSIKIVGRAHGAALPIVSLTVWHGALQVHWALIAAVLNDVFGIQSRGGCLCAGPYSQALLGIDAPRAAALEQQLLLKRELLRPGVVRLSFAYYLSLASFSYILAAVEWVAAHAVELLALYTPVHDTGEWRVNRSAMASLKDEGYARAPASARAHKELIASVTEHDGAGHAVQAMRGGTKTHPRRWLQDLKLGADGRVSLPDYRIRVHVAEVGSPAPAPRVDERMLLDAYLAEADMLLAGVRAKPLLGTSHHAPDAVLPAPEARALRWFALAGDVVPAGAALPSAADLLAAGLWPMTLQCYDSRALPAPAATTHVDSGSADAPMDDAPVGGDAAPASVFSSLDSRTWSQLAPPSLPLLRAALAAGGASKEYAAWDGVDGVLESGAEPRAAPAHTSGAPSARSGRKQTPSTAAASARTSASGDSGGSGATGGAAHVGAKRARLDDAAAAAAAAARAPGEGGSALADATPSTVAAPAASLSLESVAGAAGEGGAVAPGTSIAAPALAAASAVTSSVRASSSGGRDGVSAAPTRTWTEDDYRARAARFQTVKAGLQKLPKPPQPLTRQMRAAIVRAYTDFSMLRDGDRLLIGLSGGKDSLSLLILMLMLQEKSPVRIEIGACTVDPMYPGFDPSPLKHFLASLGVPYFYESQPIIDLAAEHMGRESICAWCSRMKRGILYTTARREGYNVLVLGQHLDDFAESFVMSAFRNGLLRTMKAHYLNDAGDIRIIRPLVYVRERQTREFAAAMALPIINENCPACYTGPTERYHVKKLLATEESTNGGLFPSLSRAMRVLMTDDGARAVRRMGLALEAASLSGAGSQQKRTRGKGGAEASGSSAEGAAACGAGGGVSMDDDDDDAGAALEDVLGAAAATCTLIDGRAVCTTGGCAMDDDDDEATA